MADFFFLAAMSWKSYGVENFVNSGCSNVASLLAFVLLLFLFCLKPCMFAYEWMVA